MSGMMRAFIVSMLLMLACFAGFGCTGALVFEVGLGIGSVLVIVCGSLLDTRGE